jgi:hypothetical protein
LFEQKGRNYRLSPDVLKISHRERRLLIASATHSSVLDVSKSLVVRLLSVRNGHYGRSVNQRRYLLGSLSLLNRLLFLYFLTMMMMKRFVTDGGRRAGRAQLHVNVGLLVRLRDRVGSSRDGELRHGRRLVAAVVGLHGCDRGHLLLLLRRLDVNHRLLELRVEQRRRYVARR